MITVDEAGDVAAFANYTSADAAHTPAATPKPAAAPAPTPTPAPVAAAPVPTSAPSAPSTGDRVVASPYAKKLARESGITLAPITGTGPKGRIVAEDVLLAQKTVVTPPIAPTPAAPIPVPVPAPKISIPSTGLPSGVYQDFELSDLALAVSSRQTWSKANVPHYYLSVDINLEKVLAMREALNGSISGSGGGGNGSEETRIGVLDFFVKASALAMKKVCQSCLRQLIFYNYHR